MVIFRVVPGVTIALRVLPVECYNRIYESISKNANRAIHIGPYIGRAIYVGRAIYIGRAIYRQDHIYAGPHIGRTIHRHGHI